MFSLNQYLAEAWSEELRRRAKRHRTAAGHAPERVAERLDPPVQTIAIRYATAKDFAAIVRLAALDSRPAPAPPVLLAEVDGDLRAACSLRDDTAISDPFERTAQLCELLVTRANQLRTRARPASAKSERRAVVRRAADSSGLRRCLS